MTWKHVLALAAAAATISTSCAAMAQDERDAPTAERIREIGGALEGRHRWHRIEPARGSRKGEDDRMSKTIDEELFERSMRLSSKMRDRLTMEHEEEEAVMGHGPHGLPAKGQETGRSS